MAPHTKARRKSNRLGNKLRYLRQLKRLTQRELAEKTGLSLVTIANLETGKHYPTIATLRLLDEALGQQVETVVLDEASRWA